MSGPVQAEADWDGDWASQVPGAESPPCRDGFAPAFTATLHDRRAPFTVRWRCGHAHADAGLAEVCALAARRALDRGDLQAVHHGSRPEPGEVTVSRHFPATVTVSRPARPAVRLAADPGVTVTVAVPSGGTVSTRAAAGGNFEVTVSGPEGD